MQSGPGLVLLGLSAEKQQAGFVPIAVGNDARRFLRLAAIRRIAARIPPLLWPGRFFEALVPQRHLKSHVGLTLS